MKIIDETDQTYAIRVMVDNDGDMLLSSDYESFWINRKQAAQLAELLKRYADTGRIDE